MNPHEEQKLIKTVFTTPDGEKLLTLLMKEYVLAPIFSKDPLELASRAGVQDLITNLLLQTGALNDE